jgi:hypothetical protein
MHQLLNEPKEQALRYVNCPQIGQKQKPAILRATVRAVPDLGLRGNASPVCIQAAVGNFVMVWRLVVWFGEMLVFVKG